MLGRSDWLTGLCVPDIKVGMYGHRRSKMTRATEPHYASGEPPMMAQLHSILTFRAYNGWRDIKHVS
jgi:hypothetical protein